MDIKGKLDIYQHDIVLFKYSSYHIQIKFRIEVKNKLIKTDSIPFFFYKTKFQMKWIKIN